MYNNYKNSEQNYFINIILKNIFQFAWNMQFINISQIAENLIIEFCVTFNFTNSKNFILKKFWMRVMESSHIHKIWLWRIFDLSFFLSLGERARAIGYSKITTESEECFSSTKSLHLCEVHSGEMGDSCRMKFCNRIMRELVILAPRRTSTMWRFQSR